MKILDTKNDSRGQRMTKVASPPRLPAFVRMTELINVVIDTPKAAPLKLKFEETSRVFRVHKAMPLALALAFRSTLASFHRRAVAMAIH